MESREGRHEMVRVAREAPEDGVKVAPVPTWIVSHFDNMLHAYDADAKRIVCPVGDHQLAYEFVEGDWESSASPNKCLDCAEALRPR
jgi:hypothetical protein